MKTTSKMGRAIKAIEKAQDGWGTANWTHELQDGVSRDNPEYCTGDQADICDTCADAKRDASAAHDLGETAIAALERGDVNTARAAVENAAELECDYGDDPIWSPAVVAVQAVVAIGDRVEAGEGDVTPAPLDLLTVCD